MSPLYYEDEILRAVLGPDGPRSKVADKEKFNSLVAILCQSEEARGILRSKGYGDIGTSIDQAVRQVPGKGARCVS